MKDNKVRMPSSMAGLTSFSEETKSRVVIKPMHVIIIIVFVMIIEFFLYAQGRALLGLA